MDGELGEQRGRSHRRSVASVARSDSYRRAKGDLHEEEDSRIGGRNTRSHASMPNRGNKYRRATSATHLGDG